MREKHRGRMPKIVVMCKNVHNANGAEGAEGRSKKVEETEKVEEAEKEHEEENHETEISSSASSDKSVSSSINEGLMNSVPIEILEAAFAEEEEPNGGNENETSAVPAKNSTESEPQ